MTICRLTTKIAATFIAASALGCASEAKAGCLDWLFGRSNAYSSPAYTANYPVAGYTANYPYTPVTSPMGIVPGTTPVAGVPVSGYSSVNTFPNASAGVVAAQRPAITVQGDPAYPNGYAYPGYTNVQTFNNPSVYTGLPVTTPANVTPYQSSRIPLSSGVPLATALRGSANPVFPSATYTSNYATPGYNNAVAPTSYAAPVGTTALPLAYEQPRWRLGSGLARFFNSLLGRNTDYVTTYNQVPITYYRPVTTLDPVTGTSVTTQQGCSSYVQQLQRVPYNTLMPTTITPSQTIAPAAIDPCTIPYGAAPTTNTYGQTQVLPQTSIPGTFSTPSAIGQVGGEFSQGSSGVTTIPSTVPGATMPGSGYPNQAPLTGADPADQRDTGMPELQYQQRPSFGSSTEQGTGTANGSTNNTQTQTPDNSSQSYGTDLNPYDDYYRFKEQSDGSQPQSQPESSGDAAEPGIQLDPPVTGRMRGSNPNGLFRNDERLTTQTPPSLSLQSNANQTINNQTPAPIAPTYSSVRPVGVPPVKPTIAQPANGSSQTQPTGLSQRTIPQARDRSEVPSFTSQPSGLQNQSSDLEPPPLPPASNRSVEGFQTNSRQIGVEVKEVKLRENPIQQVSSWDSLDPLPAPTVVRANLAQPHPVSKPVVQPAPRKQRSSAGWVPVQ
ncbi:hypothetical protein LOC67_04630 [Stieleria sp. JC731]|uniref:hypothetical protein n=1 Tax=Pirellulaceae TaxID=2691357 RepID=UPI001E327234|nr:hypothetical protein [Stieleria sp. JC731]MCC9599839.1 hypothetical protein [Stieleria sp. JC731]